MKSMTTMKLKSRKAPKFAIAAAALVLVSAQALVPAHAQAAGSIAGRAAICAETFSAPSKSARETALEKRYGIKSSDLVYTANQKYAVQIKMGDYKTISPKFDPKKPVVTLAKTYDAVIVGGGPSGLTSALYLAEAGKSVLVLERNEKMGGLAMGDELNGIRAGGGAAYSIGAENAAEKEIFKKIGLKDFATKLEIKEPIDSYLWNGKLYEGIWEEHTLEQLPQSFALFKFALLKLADQGASGLTDLKYWADNQNMAKLVRGMPDLMAKWPEPEAKAILAKYRADLKVPKQDPMKDVLDLLDLYGRSALGGTTSEISGRQFIAFYSSEIETRYTGTLGTGTIAEALLKKLAKYPNVELRTSAPAAQIHSTADGSRTIFLEGGNQFEANAKNLIFAAPVTLAPKMIVGLEAKDPSKVKAISKLEMTDYAVHVVRLKGHPYRATYDTWSHGTGGAQEPSDFILGRWQDPKIKAYDGIREFEKEPVDDYGIITVYQPLGDANPKNFESTHYLDLVEKAVNNMRAKLDPLAQEKGQKIEVELVQSYRWPYSIHKVKPGALKEWPLLERSVDRIHFVNNTTAAPELEPAMVRGAEAAKEILKDEQSSGQSTSQSTSQSNVGMSTR